VETGRLDTHETETLLRSLLTPMLEAGADQVVLGCSHYPFLLPAIERVVGPDVMVVDPSPAVARQTTRILARWKLKADRERVGQRAFCTTGDAGQFAVMAKRLLPSLWDDASEVRALCWREGRLGLC
jgi:glutamate racemase